MKAPGRSWKRVAVVLITVVALAGGAFVYLSMNRSPSGTALALSLTPGTTYRYSMHMGMNGTISAGAASLPFKGDFTEVFSWKVTSINPQGVATVDLTVESIAGTVNGQPMPKAGPIHAEIRVARSGEILTGGDLGSASGGSSGFQFPGADQFTPILPDHPVSPGDTWSKNFSQAFPFGSGSLKFSSNNTFVRYETIGGIKTDVIYSDMTVPLDITIDLRKLLSLTGQAATGVPKGTNPTIAYAGQIGIKQTAWLDPAKGEVVQSASSGAFDMRMTFKGFPQNQMPPSATVTFKGTISLAVNRKH
jgi:hypothetical protein